MRTFLRQQLESRLERVLASLTRLKVLVPEKHDLVLMKAVRCYEHDLEALAEIHARSRLDLEVLVRRFRHEMTPIGDPARIRDNFLLAVERSSGFESQHQQRLTGQSPHLPRRHRRSSDLFPVLTRAARGLLEPSGGIVSRRPRRILRVGSEARRLA